MRLIWLALLLSSCHDGVTEASPSEPVTAKAHAIDENEAIIRSAPQNKEWGRREMAVATPEGHRMMFAQRIE